MLNFIIIIITIIIIIIIIISNLSSIIIVIVIIVTSSSLSIYFQYHLKFFFCGLDGMFRKLALYIQYFF